MTEASYTAWDDNLYEWPPPDGWYEASDGKWWPEGYGPSGEQELPGGSTEASSGAPGQSNSSVSSPGDSMTATPDGGSTEDSGAASEEETDDQGQRRVYDELPSIDDVFGGVDPFSDDDSDKSETAEDETDDEEIADQLSSDDDPTVESGQNDQDDHIAESGQDDRIVESDQAGPTVESGQADQDDRIAESGEAEGLHRDAGAGMRLTGTVGRAHHGRAHLDHGHYEDEDEDEDDREAVEASNGLPGVYASDHDRGDPDEIGDEEEIDEGENNGFGRDPARVSVRGPIAEGPTSGDESDRRDPPITNYGEANAAVIDPLVAGSEYPDEMAEPNPPRYGPAGHDLPAMASAGPSTLDHPPRGPVPDDYGDAGTHLAGPPAGLAGRSADAYEGRFGSGGGGHLEGDLDQGSYADEREPAERTSDSYTGAPRNAWPLAVVAISVAVIVVTVVTFFALALRGRDDVASDAGDTGSTEAAGGPVEGAFDVPYEFGAGVGIHYDDVDSGKQQRWIIQVLSPVVDGTSQLTADGAADAPSGEEVFALTRVRVTYEVGPGAGDMSDLFLNSMGPSLTRFTQAEQGCPTVPEPLDLTASLQPAESIEGNICWRVPAAELAQLRLAVEARLVDGTVFLALN